MASLRFLLFVVAFHEKLISTTTASYLLYSLYVYATSIYVWTSKYISLSGSVFVQKL